MRLNVSKFTATGDDLLTVNVEIPSLLLKFARIPNFDQFFRQFENLMNYWLTLIFHYEFYIINR